MIRHTPRSTLFPYTTLFRSAFRSRLSKLIEENYAHIAGFVERYCELTGEVPPIPARELAIDRKSTRLNSSHVEISYAVFCLKKKKLVTLSIHVTLVWPANQT